MQHGFQMIRFSDLVSLHVMIFHEYHVRTEPKYFHSVNINDKVHHLHSSANSLNPPFKYSHLPHIHIF